jgi:hypothetical protein
MMGRWKGPTAVCKRFSPWWLAALLFIVCVALKLNGSSVAIWQTLLHEPGKPAGLLCFTPKAARFDEWNVITPAILSQARLC